MELINMLHMLPVTEEINTIHRIDMAAFDSILYSENVSHNVFTHVKDIFDCTGSVLKYQMVMNSVKNSVIPTI